VGIDARDKALFGAGEESNAAEQRLSPVAAVAIAGLQTLLLAVTLGFGA